MTLLIRFNPHHPQVRPIRAASPPPCAAGSECLDLLPPALLICSFSPPVFIRPQTSRRAPFVYIRSVVLCVVFTARHQLGPRPVAALSARVADISPDDTLPPRCVLVKSNSEHLEQILASESQSPFDGAASVMDLNSCGVLRVPRLLKSWPLAWRRRT